MLFYSFVIELFNKNLVKMKSKVIRQCLILHSLSPHVLEERVPGLYVLTVLNACENVPTEQWWFKGRLKRHIHNHMNFNFMESAYKYLLHWILPKWEFHTFWAITRFNTEESCHWKTFRASVWRPKTELHSNSPLVNF